MRSRKAGGSEGEGQKKQELIENRKEGGNAPVKNWQTKKGRRRKGNRK